MIGRLWIAVFALGGLMACKADEPANAAPAQGGRAGGGPGGGGAAGGRGGAATITLAAADISVVQPSTIEEMSAVSGDLHPIETVSVRARLEGDIDRVLVREGEQVRSGQLLAQFEPSEQENAVKSAEADKAAATADLANAEWNAEQSARLFKAGAIAERDNKAAQQAVIASQARLAAADAKVRSTSSIVRDTRVMSPTAGIVDKRQVENGEHVARGATLFSVVRNDVLELEAAMPGRDASTIRIGQTVRFVADGRPFTGHVARVSPTIDPVSRSITVYVQVPNSSGALRGGTFATGQVISRTLTNVLSVPREAIHQTQNGESQYVYRIVDKSIDVATIQTGVVDDQRGIVEVLGGLKAGDRIVSGNVGVLGRGMQVTIAGEESAGRGRGGGKTGGKRAAPR